MLVTLALLLLLQTKADQEASGVIFETQEASVSAARIVSNPDVMLGKPVVEGTRITVELILERLSGGESVDQILNSYPTMSREGVLAAIKYAVDILSFDAVYPVGA